MVLALSCPNNENEKKGRDRADVWDNLYATPNNWDDCEPGRFSCAFPAHHCVTSIQGSSITSISLWPAELLLMKLSLFPVTTPSCPLIPTKVSVLG